VSHAASVRIERSVPTIHELVATARRRLHASGIGGDEADLDARLLAEHVLGWDAARYFTDGGDLASTDFELQYGAAIKRRSHREPVAYITGTQEFWGLAFTVSPAVLIPRPETEIIVESVLEILDDRRKPHRIADACTGSGCLAVAIACERPGSRLVATDVSPTALEIASVNARRHGVEDRIACVRADVLSGVDGPFDVVVANPPYVPEADLAALQPEVVQYEPRVALAAGADGLDVVRTLAAQARGVLAPGGWLVFEFGFSQSEAVGLLVSSAGLELVEMRNDLQGIPRTALARRTSSFGKG
jgi:release factor glutamine methyltransferase